MGLRRLDDQGLLLVLHGLLLQGLLLQELLLQGRRRQRQLQGQKAAQAGGEVGPHCTGTNTEIAGTTGLLSRG